LIVVDDEIPSSFLLDDEGYSAIIGGWFHLLLVVVQHGFIWQHSTLNEG
jgi:hypothetical protein